MVPDSYTAEEGKDGLKILKREERMASKYTNSWCQTYQQLKGRMTKKNKKKCYRLFHRLQTNGTEIYQQPVSDLYTEEGKEGLKV